MSHRQAQDDTDADVGIRECIAARPPRSFVVRAGAGSGKTTSLIKALDSILKAYGPVLRRRRQQVACITYTEVAAQEVRADVEDDPLVHVSTIHSFLWTIVKGFQADIKASVGRRLDDKVATLKDEAAQFGSRVKERTRDKNRRDTERAAQQRQALERVQAFTYGTGSDYGRGVLGHDDVIKIATSLLQERPLFRTVVGQRFPFMLVDESQDTMPQVVAAFKALEAQMRASFCLGFFGDPMQQIYMTGIGAIPLEQGWADIDKPDNFRCATSVLRVANAVRSGGDGLVQVRGLRERVNGVDQEIVGTARIFVLPADDRRDDSLKQVREWISRHNSDRLWVSEAPGAVKVLVIVHRMAATRLGFEALYAALNDKATDAIKQGFLDGTAWPLRPFLSFVLPLCEAVTAQRDFDVMTLLRQNCPRLEKEQLRNADVAQILAELREMNRRIVDLMKPGGGSVRDVLELLHAQRIVELDDKLVGYLVIGQEVADKGETASSAGEEDDIELRVMDAFLACPASELSPYRDYLDNRSPFSTQQGVKGTEFERVLVILDDAESAHSQFSYEKYFGIRQPSDTDLANQREGKETVVDRTRRLLYVCCTRAKRDLAVVLFASDVDLAQQRVAESQLFEPENILRLSDL